MKLYQVIGIFNEPSPVIVYKCTITASAEIGEKKIIQFCAFGFSYFGLKLEMSQMYN